MDNVDLNALAWQTFQLPIVMEFLARKRNLLPQAESTAPAAPEMLALGSGEALAQWMDRAADELGIEIEPAAIAYAEVDQFARAAAPALLQLPKVGAVPGACPAQDDGSAPRFLAILKEGARHISIVDPDLKVRRIRFDQVRDLLCEKIEAPFLNDADQLLAISHVVESSTSQMVESSDSLRVSEQPNHRTTEPPNHPTPTTRLQDYSTTRQSAARQAIARETLVRSGYGSAQVGNGWILRLAPGATLRRQARHEGLFGLLGQYLAVNTVQKGLELGAWVMLGYCTLSGNLAWEWLVAWALFFLSASACRMPVQHVRGAIREKIMGVKAWLTYNALRLDPDAVRHQGAGQFLGSIMASGMMEDRIGNYSVMLVADLVELSFFAVILALGAGGWLQAALLVGWTLITFLMGWRYFQYGKLWNSTYHQMTSDLAERMVGHRTRLAQEDRAHWHNDEDAILNQYLLQSEHLDSIEAQLTALAARGWMIVGLAGIAYPFIFSQPSQAQLLMGLGAVLLASASLEGLASDLLSFAQGLLAWQQVQSLVQAAVKDGAAVSPPTRKSTATPDGKVPVLVARNLVFRYRDRGRTILDACNLRIQEGDRVLLEGPSGGGKSTLAALLAGLRKPESGLLLWKSLDRQTVGADEWRRRVVVVPQFHENHIFTETLAFNLLMGRRWPPLPEDLEMAEAICRELGLGDVLDRMPAKLDQPIGASGWQLSHGEASRLFIARALLQDADLVILDETFGTLDPENLQRAMQCVLNRAPTLMVIAHP